MSKVKFLFEFDTTTGAFTVVNQETGEEQKVTLKAPRSKKKVEDNNPIPQITLESNKYILNAAAVRLTGLEPDMKVCIKMRRGAPVFGTPEAFKVKEGNRLTKTYSVICKGKTNEALAAYGTIFTLTENPDGSGTFLMNGNAVAPVVDEAVEAPDENEFSEDINAFADDNIGEVEEIDGDDFFAALNGI